MKFNFPPLKKREKKLLKKDPKKAIASYRARCIVELSQSAYHGANRTRKAIAGWDKSGGDADADLLPDLADLREASRDLYRNNALGGAAIDTCVTSVVGTGLSLQCTINREILGLDEDAAAAWESRTEAEFRLWCDTADIQRKLTFYGIQELAFRSCLENGDVLITTPYLKYYGDAYGLKIQLTEADRISNPNNTIDTDTFSGGVERDGNGVVKKYHYSSVHPGNSFNKERKWSSVPAYNKLGQMVSWLLYHKVRVGQNRGIPYLAPVIEEIKQLSRMTENEIARAVVSSLFTAFIKTPTGEGLDLLDMQDGAKSKQTERDFKLGNGNILDLAEGEDVVFAEPKIPNVAFDSFHTAATKLIGARVGIPAEILLKLFNTSFTAAQAAFLEAWRFFRGKRAWLADDICKPVYNLWLTEAVASGRISAPGFLNGDPLVKYAWLGAEWVGDAPGHIRESEAIAAAIMRIESGLSNEAIETTALTGRDRDTVYRQRKKEIEQRREDDMLSTSSVTLAAAELEGKNKSGGQQ